MDISRSRGSSSEFSSHSPDSQPEAVDPRPDEGSTYSVHLMSKMTKAASGAHGSVGAQHMDNRSAVSSPEDEEDYGFEHEEDEEKDADEDSGDLSFFNPLNTWSASKNVPTARSREQRDVDAHGRHSHRKHVEKSDSNNQTMRGQGSHGKAQKQSDNKPQVRSEVESQDRAPVIHARAALLTASSERASTKTKISAKRHHDAGTRTIENITDTTRAAPNPTSHASKHPHGAATIMHSNDIVPIQKYPSSLGMHAGPKTDDLNVEDEFSVNNLRKLRAQETGTKMSRILNLIHSFHDRVDAALDEGPGKLQVRLPCTHTHVSMCVYVCIYVCVCICMCVCV